MRNAGHREESFPVARMSKEEYPPATHAPMALQWSVPIRPVRHRPTSAALVGVPDELEAVKGEHLVYACLMPQ